MYLFVIKITSNASLRFTAAKQAAVFFTCASHPHPQRTGPRSRFVPQRHAEPVAEDERRTRTFLFIYVLTLRLRTAFRRQKYKLFYIYK